MNENEQKKQQLIDNLLAVRNDERALEKKLLAIPAVPDEVKSGLTACLAKLTAFDAMISMEIDDLIDGLPSGM